MTRRIIGYPTGWTLSVLGTAEDADAAAAELRAAGVPEDDVIVISGEDVAERIARLGTSSGFLARARRTIQFLTMDQLPDLHVYELAVEDGHPVVGISIADAEERRAAIAILAKHGAHFINRFGAWATEEIAAWRGEMPDRPQHMHR
ncbi:MAG TPA: hypothetical protein VFP83_05065 [Candidatus Limnocylindria bacterium]|nr:hypothetical protein [Candidatus Limnocylindria bacterium]